MKKIYLTWAMFDKAVQEIADYYRESPDMMPDKIIGISRGGLTLAVKLSHELNLPMEPLEWQTRDGDNRDIDKLISLRGNNVLFVDDICDSGETIKQIKKICPKSRWCVWVSKHTSQVEGCVISLSKEDERWIVFPWENQN